MPSAGSDEHDVIEVLYRYATGIDRRDWKLFRSCFTKDCECDYGDIGQWHGVDEVTTYMIDAHMPFGHTLHRITNPVIDIDLTRAVARSYVHAILVPEADATVAFEAFGFYDDELTKRKSGWKIANRKFTMVRFVQPTLAG